MTSRIDALTDANGAPRIKPGLASTMRKLSEDSGEKVAIGCKIPSGLVMQLYGWRQVSQQTPSGLQSAPMN